MNQQRINGKYIFISIVAVSFTWLLHEFTHWLTSESLGYDSIMRLNSVSFAEGQEPTEWHKIYISATGPLITIFQAIIAFITLKTKGWNKYIYPFIFVPLYTRSLAGIMNFINPNDEGRISEFLGIGLFTISIIVSGFLFFLVFKISKKYGVNWKFNFWTTIITTVVSSILILSDQFFGIRLL
ncbi:hypothetical protein SAMN05421766_102126 [Zobellia uliginosa]|uniref:Peptidase M50B-like n=1 Tax=Zobellia uliginosa TaxID=143224 RepID=A0ABY1KLE8_9FLAO|nr:hypothetical protein [Zobellia uliginosa]SIS47369.1 hypothetical protein SAMN05421766_102126 [Zobellia uliginosa]